MSLKESLEEIKELNGRLAELKAEADPIERRVDELRKDLLIRMQNAGIERFSHVGLQAIEVVTRGLKITDEDRLHVSLFEAGKLAQCTKITKMTVMPEVKKVFAAGFDLAGIEETVSRTLRINKVDE